MRLLSLPLAPGEGVAWLKCDWFWLLQNGREEFGWIGDGGGRASGGTIRAVKRDFKSLESGVGLPFGILAEFLERATHFFGFTKYVV